MDRRSLFYKETVSTWIPDRSSSILVVGGGQTDRNVLLECGFENVVISNLDSRMEGHEFLPYQWSYQDAESLAFADKQFDYAVVHAALHHCSSPHRALLEMYRVASRAAIVLEARDSFVMRLLERLKVSQEYEHAAVFHNDCQFGGLNNTEIPNYVYRWTEREIEKTIRSFDPTRRHRFSYRYGYSLPAIVGMGSGNLARVMLVRAVAPLYGLLARSLPKQQNLFAFMVEKSDSPASLHPWLREAGETPRFNVEWARRMYSS